MAEPFGVCSMCRKPIEKGQRIYRCSVSTCNSGKVKLFFCGLSCWDAHLPTARHRTAFAVEEKAGAPAPGAPTGGKRPS